MVPSGERLTAQLLIDCSKTAVMGLIIIAISLRLILMLCSIQDAFEVVNPLGATRGKHKVLGVYYILGNLPEICSRIDT